MLQAQRHWGGGWDPRAAGLQGLWGRQGGLKDGGVGEEGEGVLAPACLPPDGFYGPASPSLRLMGCRTHGSHCVRVSAGWGRAGMGGAHLPPPQGPPLSLRAALVLLRGLGPPCSGEPGTHTQPGSCPQTSPPVGPGLRRGRMGTPGRAGPCSQSLWGRRGASRSRPGTGMGTGKGIRQQSWERRPTPSPCQTHTKLLPDPHQACAILCLTHAPPHQIHAEPRASPSQDHPQNPPNSPAAHAKPPGTFHPCHLVG